MEKVRLGRTGLMVTRTAFGALPIQRVSFDEAARLLRKAYESGINFFDTARGYSDSKEKIGRALSDVRTEVIINMAARMSLLLRRAPSENFLTRDWQEKMSRIENCIECGRCKDRCPYGLDTPELLKKNLKDYRTFLK